jgi:hypothetical protein
MLEGPYRAGRWPGLTPAGAGVLVCGALFLAASEVLIGPLQRPMPDLPVLGATALVPLVIATRIINMPGTASAVCGAYLLPRSLLSVVLPGLELPPLLLAPALAFDLALWLSQADLSQVRGLWPLLQCRWRKSTAAVARRTSSRWAAAAGAVFGLVLSVVEPPFETLIGGDPFVWAGSTVLLAAGATATVVCALVAAALSGRGIAS